MTYEQGAELLLKVDEQKTLIADLGEQLTKLQTANDWMFLALCAVVFASLVIAFRR